MLESSLRQGKKVEIVDAKLLQDIREGEACPVKHRTVPFIDCKGKCLQ